MHVRHGGMVFRRREKQTRLAITLAAQEAARQRTESRDPRWLTDYGNEYALDYERRAVSVIRAVLAPNEPIVCAGRAIMVDPRVNTEAYVCLTDRRLLVTLFDSRKPWNQSMPWEFARSVINEVVPDDQGRAVLVKLLNTASGEKGRFVLYTGRQGAELRSALLGSLEGRPDTNP